MNEVAITVQDKDVIKAEWKNEDGDRRHIAFHKLDKETGDCLLTHYQEWDKDGRYWVRGDNGYASGYDGGLNNMEARDVHIPEQVHSAILNKALELKRS